jgi:Tol biopolymer transport system component
MGAEAHRMTAAAERLSAALTGRYRIERELGAGGMATVYLAEDLKHDRKVAIKVLKPELAAVLGAERFVVEIKTTASLSHPHILPLFDSGTADGFLFYVMPYIQGETIREKLNRESQFGVDEAVRVAREVADALDYAHRHGVIHRDIKPENILLHDGRAMVMDFGIALAVSAAAGGRMTETGLSLGTPHYMSPEQATAEKDISARSDVYSLASVLYEMLAGQPPHVGGSAQQIIMKIITEPAEPVTKMRKAVPPNVASALARALEKLPADRFENAKAFADALGNASFVTAHTTAGRALPAAPRWRRALLPAVAVAAGGIGFALAGVWRSGESTAQAPARFVVSAPPALPLNVSSQVSDLAISPDGRLVVYVVGSSRALYVRSVNSLSGTLLPGTEQAGSPVFSPDSKWIAFSALGDRASGSVKKVPSGGGPVVPLGDVPASRGISWGLNDTIVVSTFVDLVALPGDGGVAITLTGVDTTIGSSPIRWFPEVLPGGGIVYTGRARDGSLHLAVFDRRTGTERVLPQVGASVRWSPTGHLVYSAQGALWALPFDPVRLEATGAPVLVLSGVGSKASGASNFAIARDAGTLVYAAGAAAQGQSWLAWIDTLGRQQPVEGARPGVYRDPRFSPDGSRLAVALGSHVFTYDISRATLSQVTRDSVDNYAPVWTPDGRRIAFTSTRGAGRRLYVHQADGTGSDQLLLTGRNGLVDLRAVDITRDGSTILATRVPPLLTCWIGRVKVGDAKDTDSADVARNSVCNDFLRLSPDGRWVAYSVGLAGGSVAMVERFPEGGMRQQLSVGEGRFPLWSRDGRTAYYQSGDSMMAVSVATTGVLSIGRPRLLFRADFLVFGAGRHNADLGPNGRFAVILAAPPAGGNAAGPVRPDEMLPGSVVLIQDWTSELMRIMAKK